MPRYDDRYSSTRLYVGHLSSRTRTRDLEDIFSRYGRVRDVDMKRDYAFVEFSDPRDADDARYALNGRDFDGSRIIVEFAKGAPRGPGGSRDFGGRGPPPGAGRCFNCGLDGHWARDCKAGDWKNKCYRCGERGHIERNCQNSPKKLRRGDSDSRSPSPRRRGRSFSRSRSYSRSRSPPKRERSIGYDDRSRSPRRRSPKRQKVSPVSSRSRKRSLSPDDRSPRRRRSFSPDDRSPRRGRSVSPDDRSPRRGLSLSPDDRGPRKGHSLSPDDRSPRRGRSLSPREGDRRANGSDSPRAKSRSPADDADRDSPRDRNGCSPFEENGGSGGRSPAPVARNGRSGRVDEENEDYYAFPGGSE